jgi:hypothetical protein
VSMGRSSSRDRQERRDRLTLRGGAGNLPPGAITKRQASNKGSDKHACHHQPASPSSGHHRPRRGLVLGIESAAQEIPIDCWVNNERDLPPGSNSVGEYCGFADGSVIRQLCADPHNINTRYCADPHGVLAKGHEARANAQEIPSEAECLLSQWCSYENNVDNLNYTRCHALYPKEMDGETYR